MPDNKKSRTVKADELNEMHREYLKNLAAAQFRVWHVPQVPGKPFRVDCNSLGTAKALVDVLAIYDLFQYENRIKPDYANASGIEYWDAQEKAWVGWDDYQEDDYREAILLFGVGTTPSTPDPWALVPGTAMKAVR